ncbi:DNA-binding transcriptional regulator, GntR family [Streptomyces zhaozhouensis]|uniref:DNA-binding transcriptional regulator, GntR family n=1 Tax=Streptomyces zhaozhouensis TaxID=1300267 RepID=A0A286DWB2_9ACTN|nr:GntR family transcriptional regulator [Streptomyces zhaozhouensis]SOD62948.1 DNA-binding transcriptional regulator, GntR family [Streptomyces zhaozhouensis]
MGTTTGRTASRPGTAPAEPKYWQLRTALTDALDAEFSVGQVLPDERTLAARFGVARATLRQALDQLELEGRLQRRRGVGTTVAPPRVGVDVSPAGQTWPGAEDDPWTVTGLATVAAPAAVAQALDVPRGTPLSLVGRVLVAAGQPVAIERLYVLPGARPAEGADEALAALRDQPLEGQDRSVELGSADAEQSRGLDRLPGSPVLLVTTRYTAAGRVAAVSLATYRADTCRLTFAPAGGAL